MPPLLVGPGRLLVAALVVADLLADVDGIRGPPPPAEQRLAADVQSPAHLLHRHPRVFPFAAGPCAPPRTPARSGPGSDAAPARRTAAPRSASAPPPTSPPGSRARPSPGGRLPAAVAPTARPSRWSGSTSPRPSPR